LLPVSFVLCIYKCVLFLSSGAAGRVFYFAGSDKYAFANNWNRELALLLAPSEQKRERALTAFCFCHPLLYYLILRASGTVSSNFICSPACMQPCVESASERGSQLHTTYPRKTASLLCSLSRRGKHASAHRQLLIISEPEWQLAKLLNCPECRSETSPSNVHGRDSAAPERG
jgi:hypothetical protein